MIAWPPSPEYVALWQSRGVVFHGQRGRFACAYLRRGAVAVVADFVVNPALRDGRYFRAAWRSVLDHLRSLGVKVIVGRAKGRMVRLWQRLGATETEPGWLRMRI